MLIWHGQRRRSGLIAESRASSSCFSANRLSSTKKKKVLAIQPFEFARQLIGRARARAVRIKAVDQAEIASETAAVPVLRQFHRRAALASEDQAVESLFGERLSLR